MVTIDSIVHYSQSMVDNNSALTSTSTIEEISDVICSLCRQDGKITCIQQWCLEDELFKVKERASTGHQIEQDFGKILMNLGVGLDSFSGADRLKENKKTDERESPQEA